MMKARKGYSQIMLKLLFSSLLFKALFLGWQIPSSSPINFPNYLQYLAMKCLAVVKIKKLMLQECDQDSLIFFFSITNVNDHILHTLILEDQET
ncbi:hypothetical protein PanWU01x14_010440 [Parasponia andersonii]|uniref:Uncharacterized protein n=1 Tax=Parasponia andersonii TaxID=3476 RepID=A0A2P5E2P6_PARAD|nr:hypothetical protein PanWU01x14_010440 [Parasponia andersonii]